MPVVRTIFSTYPNPIFLWCKRALSLRQAKVDLFIATKREDWNYQNIEINRGFSTTREIKASSLELKQLPVVYVMLTYKVTPDIPFSKTNWAANKSSPNTEWMKILGKLEIIFFKHWIFVTFV